MADRFVLCLRDEHLAVRTVPGRNLVTPPELARDAPRLDVFHPLEVGLLPVLRHERGFAQTHGRNRRLRQLLGVDVPLIRQIGFDDRAGAVAVRHHVRVRLDLVEEAEIFEARDDRLARGEAIHAIKFFRQHQRAFGQTAQIILVVG